MTEDNNASSSLRSSVMRGVTWLFLASLIAKIMGIATLYVTGLLLSKQDFALYAIAIAWGEILGFLRNGGMHKILIQRGRSFKWLFPDVLTLSWGINVFWLLVLVAAAPFIAESYGAPEVLALLLVIALSIPAWTIGTLLQSKLAIDRRFGVLSTMSVYSALVRNGGIIALAFLGFGPMSFAIPLVAAALFETLYLYFKTGVSCRPKMPRLRMVRPLVRDSAWIMFGMLAMALAVNGDYMVIGILEEKEILGVYFFGFQLTVAIFTMITRSLWAVLTPSFASMNTDRSRQEYAFLRALEMSALMIFFISLAMTAVAEPLVHWVWSGKWDEAAPVIQIIAATAIPRVVSPLCRSLLEARGLWRLVAVITWLEALGLMAAAAAGAILGGLMTIAIAIGVYNVLLALAYIVVIQRNTELSVGAIFWAVFSPYGVAGLSLAVSWGIIMLYPVTAGPFLEAAVTGAGFVMAFTGLTWLIKRTLFRECFAFAKRLIGGK